MSRTTSAVLKVVPAGAASLTVSTGVAWTYGSWVEFIASASADLHIVGLATTNSLSNQQVELQIGTGAAGAEAALHTIRFFYEGSGQHQALMLPVPLGGINAGDRVALRARCQSPSTGYLLSLLYFEGFTATHETSTAPMACAPSGAAAPTITPSASAWANSSWVELTSGEAEEIAILGIAAATPVANSDLEFDLGTGAAGAETVITTIRASSIADNAGAFRNLWLPAPFPVAASTRVAVRMRKAGTSTTTHSAALVYIDGTTLL